MNTRQYLDRCRKLTASGSDYAVAKLLGVSEDAINGYRTGRRHMDNTTCRKIAETLGVPLVDVIVAAEVERAKNAEDRAAWRKWVKKTARVALVVGIVAADSIYFPATGNHKPATPAAMDAATKIASIAFEVDVDAQASGR